MWDMDPTTPTREGWVIELQGDKTFLDFELTHYFRQGSVRVFERENRIYLQADEIDVQPDFRSAEEQAHKLLRTICGLFGVVATPDKARPVAAIPRYADGNWGERIDLVHLELNKGISISFRVPTDRAQKALALALRDDRVRRALDEFAGEPNFPRLRRVYEMIWTEYDLTQSNADTKMVKAGLAKEVAEFVHFRNTVNRSPEGAVHSTPFGRPPYPRAMSLEEARSYLRGLLNRWIDTKL